MTKDEWISKATAAMQQWCKRNKRVAGNFEMLRADVAQRMEDEGEGPGDGRWWGVVQRRLRTAGSLAPSWGWMPAKSSHGSAKPVWLVKG